MAKTLLVVDDDTSLLKGLERYLREDGHNVLTASSPELALQVIRENKKDLDGVITDLSMGIHQDAALRLIRDIRRLGISAPILLQSGGVDDEVNMKRMVSTAGGNGFISKISLTFLEELQQWVAALDKGQGKNQ